MPKCQWQHGVAPWPRAMPSCQKLFAGFAAVASAGRHLLAAATKRTSGVREIAFGMCGLAAPAPSESLTATGRPCCWLFTFDCLAGVRHPSDLMREFSSIGPRCRVVQTVSTFLFVSVWLASTVRTPLLPGSRLSVSSFIWLTFFFIADSPPRGPLLAPAPKSDATRGNFFFV